MFLRFIIRQGSIELLQCCFIYKKALTSEGRFYNMILVLVLSNPKLNIRKVDFNGKYQKVSG